MPVDPRIQAALDAPLTGGRNIPVVRAKKGYASPPGSGPSDETCHSCRHIGPVRGNEYAACCQIAKKGSFGVQIYISPKSPACSKWEARTDA